MGGEQKAIYYLAGDREEKLRASPLLEAYRKKGIEVLLMDDGIDELVASAVGRYKDTELKAVNRSGAGEDLATDADKAQAKDLAPLLARVRKILGEEVKDVRASARLAEAPCCIVMDDSDPTVQMQHLARALGQRDLPEVKPILELNPGHELVRKLQGLEDEDAPGRREPAAAGAGPDPGGGGAEEPRGVRKAPHPGDVQGPSLTAGRARPYSGVAIGKPAGVVELADTEDLKSSGPARAVRVQVPSPAVPADRGELTARRADGRVAAMSCENSAKNLKICNCTYAGLPAARRVLRVPGLPPPGRGAAGLLFHRGGGADLQPLDQLLPPEARSLNSQSRASRRMGASRVTCGFPPASSSPAPLLPGELPAQLQLPPFQLFPQLRVLFRVGFQHVQAQQAQLRLRATFQQASSCARASSYRFRRIRLKA